MPTAFSGSYNGFSFGVGTSYPFTEVDGINEMVPIRSSDEAKAMADGSFPGSDYLDARTITIGVLIQGTSQADYDARCDLVQGAFGIQSIELPLTYTLGDTSASRLINCRPKKLAIPRETRRIGLSGVATAQLVATDPRKYDATLQTASTGLPSVAGAFGFNFGFNFGFGGSGSGGLLGVTNAGNYRTYPMFSILGPADNPSIVNETTGQTMKFLLSLGSTDTLTVDCLNRLALLNGTGNRNNTLAFGYDWIYYPPGGAAVRFNADNYAGGALLTSQHRSAWL